MILTNWKNLKELCLKKYENWFKMNNEDFDFLQMLCVSCRSKLLYLRIMSNLNKLVIKDFDISNRQK